MFNAKLWKQQQNGYVDFAKIISTERPNDRHTFDRYVDVIVIKRI